MKKQYLDKIVFNNETTELNYTIGNKMYIYEMDPVLEYIKCQDIKYTNIIDITDPLNTKSFIKPDPFLATNIHGLPVTQVLFMDNKSIKTDDYPSISVRDPIICSVVHKNDIFIVMAKSIVRFGNSFEQKELLSTYNNQNGLFAINKDNKTKKTIIVTLGEAQGDILIWKINKEKLSLVVSDSEKKVIHAHQNNIQCIAISRDGQYVATASECGSNIHVYNTNDYSLVNSFKRGLFSKEIYNLCFNWNGSMIVCISASGTIHYYDLNNDDKNTRSIFSSYIKMIPYAPNLDNIKWGCSSLNIVLSSKTECEFDSNDMLHIVTYDGKYYRIPKNRDGISEPFDLQIV